MNRQLLKGPTGNATICPPTTQRTWYFSLHEIRVLTKMLNQMVSHVPWRFLHPIVLYKLIVRRCLLSRMRNDLFLLMNITFGFHAEWNRLSSVTSDAIQSFLIPIDQSKVRHSNWPHKYLGSKMKNVEIQTHARAIQSDAGTKNCCIRQITMLVLNLGLESCNNLNFYMLSLTYSVFIAQAAYLRWAN